jgi:hypothetical protein
MAVLEYASMPTDLNEAQVRDVASRQKQIIYCILAYFGLVVMLLVSINNKATKLLKQNGISVGLLGAKV